MSGESQIGICPRCGRDLVRGMTPTGKVCFRCPSCGGVAVTLPALRESLDARSIAMLTHAARAAEHAGCVCPGCGGRMSLLKVGDGKDKVEIDVCGHCLSVWCDKGEYETLAPPPPPKPGEKTMRELLQQSSPEVRERYAAVLLESLPEDVSPSDFDFGDILRDVACLVIGAPTLWRTVKPTSPLFAIALSLALPIMQACAYYSCHAPSSLCGFRRRDFWCLCEHMAKKFGFCLSAPLNAISFPFVQVSGVTALFGALLLFMPLAVIERRVGHAKFIGLFFAFVATSVVVQALFLSVGLASGILCGIAPVAFGFLAYSSFAWPDLRTKGPIGRMGLYAGIVELYLLLFTFLKAISCEFFSFGFGPIAACLALGAVLGRRAMRRASPYGITH